MSHFSHAYLGGTFDLFHAGHVQFFHWAKQSFDKVTVALNQDEFVKKYKGRNPVQCLEERMAIVAACRYVDNVVINTGDEDSKPSLLVVYPTHIVNGSDWGRERLLAQMGLTEEFLWCHGFKISLCPLLRHFSSTELKQRVKQQ